jgi:signal recognition particle GTPase
MKEDRLSSAAARRSLIVADAERAEVLATPPLDFGLTVMVLGLQGVGKTATIHSLLGKPQPAGYQETNKVRRLDPCRVGSQARVIGGWHALLAS